jgi:hypothetical protein
LIGARGELTRQAARSAAKAFRKIAAKGPKALVHIMIAGYDDDPREIADIPEAREYVCRWARFAAIDSIAAAQASPLNDDSVGVLAACGCFPEVDPDDVMVIARN